jgi:DNA-binding beta-propeller fold protein YncE
VNNVGRRAAVLLCVLGAVGAGGCAATPDRGDEDKNLQLVWPAPPETARIRFVGEISKASDVGRERAASNRLTEKLLGIKSEEAHLLAKPYGVHADRRGRVYVADSATGKVLVFDGEAKAVTVLGDDGLGRLGKAMGVASDAAGRVYVTDAGAHRVVVFGPDGDFVTALGGEGVLAKPVGIALDEQRGRVYVADSYGHQLVAFDREGDVVFVLGRKGVPGEIAAGSHDHAWNRSSKNGEFRFPTNVSTDREGKIYVMDTMNFRVQIFSPEGEFLSTFGQLGDGFGQFARPKGIAVDTEGHIYVSDAIFHNIQIFNQEGQLLLFFGRLGTRKGEFYLPAGIFVDESNRIYVVDQYNHRIQVFQYLKQTDVANQAGNAR